jgi:hypothetical protein
MKAMVLGLRPDYFYPGKLSLWHSNNTLYAANMGASMICRALLRQFNADYIEQFDDSDYLKSNYDVCIMALATHLHPTRDISFFTDLVEKLEIRTVLLSAGIKDYETQLSKDYRIHPSVVRLLQIVSSRSKWIGVRGPYSASVLHNYGFKNVVPIGCPSMYGGLNRGLSINKPPNFSKPLLVYHRSLLHSCPELIVKTTLLGQDFEDEVIFTETLKDDEELRRFIEGFYNSRGELENTKRILKHNGVFFLEFKKWFDFIGEHDFVVGPRLHGCLGALIQGIPAVMTPRDLRGREVAEFYKLPTATYEDLNSKPLQEIYETASFEEFNRLYAKRYEKYVKLLEENLLEHTLQPSSAVLVDSKHKHNGVEA